MHVPGVTGLQRARAALPASRAVARPACNPARPRGMGGVFPLPLRPWARLGGLNVHHS